MDQTQPKRSTLAVVITVIGGLLALLAIYGLFTANMPAFLVWGIIGTVLLVAGIRRINRDNRALRS